MVRHLAFCTTRRPRYIRFVPVGIVLAGLAVGFVGCQHQPLTTNETASLQPGAVPELGPALQLAALQAEDFEIVDCLLTARVRRLGTQLTYLGARRPIRTTGRDCAIRGGEYVAYDRANYATALKIWLPLAEQGDPKAQTYVGEIYEKGLGGAPDYALAATWYRRAAEQRHATAEISLGQLYERGLGVQQDMVAALNLYRRASGLGEAFDLVFASEVQALEGKVGQGNRRAERLGQQVATLQRELDQTRHQLQGLREQADAEERSLEIERRQLDERRKALEARAPRSGRELAQRDEPATRARQIEEQQAKLEQLRGLLEEHNAELARRTEELERQGLEMSARAAELQQKAATERESIGLAQRELAEQRAGLDAELRQLELQRERTADERATRAHRVEEQQAELQQQHATLEEREAELARRMEEIERRLAELSVREAQHQQEAAAKRRSIELAQRGLAEQRAELGTERRQLELQRERSADEQVTRARQFEGQQAELQQQHATLEEREAELARRAEELERRLAEIERQEAGIEQRQDEIAHLNQQAPQPDQASAENPIDFGTYYALVIGNNKYDSFRGITPLKSPQADAEAISALIKHKYGYVVTTLINATRDQILQALNTLRDNLQEKDNLLIYYAGHGMLDEENDRGHWLPVDAEPYPQTTNWISSTEITDILNSMRAKHVLVIADSCYAGSLTTSSQSVGLGVPQEERYFWLKTIANKPARMALTSGDLKPVSDGGGGQHSIFAMALLEVLGTNSEIMEGWRVYLRVSARVGDVARMYGLTQVPTYGSIKPDKYAGGDFLFVRS